MKKPKPTEADRLLHELQVHQVELESQNTELRTARDELEVALANYTELYDFAPAGYFTLAANGNITLLNLTGATLLGIERSRLIGRAFSGLIVKEQRPLFTAFLKQVFAGREKKTSDFLMEGNGPPHLVVRIRAQRSANGKECSAVMVDITDRTRTQERLQLLWEGAAVLLATNDIESMMQGLFAKIGPTLGGTMYLNYMVDESGKALRLDSYAGISEAKAQGMSRLKFGEALCGSVAELRKPLHLARVQLSEDPKAARAKELGVRAYCCNPLMVGDALLGTLSYASHTKDEFDPEELGVMQTLTHYVALAYERSQGAEALRASEIRYRRLFEAAHDGVLILDPESRKITDANPFMTELLGYSHAQLVGKELYQIGLLKDEDASQEMFRTLKKKHEARYQDLPLKSKGGRLQQVEVVANLYQEDRQPVIQCNIRDITARKHSEDALIKSAALFSALIEQAPIGVYVLDSQFRMQKINSVALPGFENVKPLIGRDFAEIVHILWPKKVADNVIAQFRHTLATGEPYQSPEFSEQRKDTGADEVYEWQIMQISLPDGKFGVVCFFDNMTKRRHAENAQRHLEVMTATNAKLEKEITRRKAVETALNASQLTTNELYETARHQKNELRNLARKLLSVQEEERKRISRELHDVIAQTLTGINVRLASLKAESNAIIPDLLVKIAHTQQMVEQSVDIVHRFARELRPSMLDDLGLIPALQSFLKTFITDTGIRVSLTAFKDIEQIGTSQRTVLYRIAQEALTNVFRHSKAAAAEIHICADEGIISMEITDDGKGFEVDGTGSVKKNNRLGLLGMRERVEMIGGTFKITSKPGKSTTVRVEVPAEIEDPKHL